MMKGVYLIIIALVVGASAIAAVAAGAASVYQTDEQTQGELQEGERPACTLNGGNGERLCERDRDRTGDCDCLNCDGVPDRLQERLRDESCLNK